MDHLPKTMELGKSKKGEEKGRSQDTVKVEESYTYFKCDLEGIAWQQHICHFLIPWQDNPLQGVQATLPSQSPKSIMGLTPWIPKIFPSMKDEDRVPSIVGALKMLPIAWRGTPMPNLILAKEDFNRRVI